MTTNDKKGQQMTTNNDKLQWNTTNDKKFNNWQKMATGTNWF